MSTPESRTATIDREVAVLADVSPGLLRQYYELTKPGITQMVALTTLAGLYLAIPTDLITFAASATNWILFAATMVGTVLISAGSCVFNHVLERENDARMKRTSTRPIPSGAVSVGQAVAFGSLLSVAGAVLLATVNPLTFWLAIVTWLTYVVVYTPLKRKTTIALLIGGVPGALPFAGGWTAVTGTMDPAAIILFMILFWWQLPHFLALSWMYRTDYAEGGFVMTAITDEQGRSVALQMIVTSAFTLASAVALTVIGVTGMLYLVGATALGCWLLFESIRFGRVRDHRSARRVLLTSYAVLMGIVALIFVDKAGPI